MLGEVWLLNQGAGFKDALACENSLNGSLWYAHFYVHTLFWIESFLWETLTSIIPYGDIVLQLEWKKHYAFNMYLP